MAFVITSIRFCSSAITVALLVAAQPLRAWGSASDAQALNRIFGDEHIAANALEVCSRASKLPLEDRFEALADWVLPSDRHPTFRVVADFSPTYPAPMTEDREHASGFRVPSGGEIVSPALDLIAVAVSLDRLEELRRSIEATTTTSVVDRIDQTALLALVDIARDDVESAKSNLSALFALLLSEGTSEPHSNDAALLCVHAAAGRRDLCRAVVEAAYRVVASYQGVVERSIWQRQFAAAFARIRQPAGWNGDDSEITGAATGLARWFPASLPRARYRGAGAPVAQWNMRPGRADNLTSHDEDFLYYTLPLRGSFEVEGDFTGFSYWRSQLLVAGKWVGPVSNHKLYDLGDIDGSTVRFPIDPPMTKVDDFIHIRTVIGNDVETTYVNGRWMHDQPLSAEPDPWLAVHSAARHNGGVRNLRITGDAAVPATVPMTSGSDLTGWICYFDEPESDDWRYVRSQTSPGEIQARRQQDFLCGCDKESALFYHRPMLEDGSIEYDFWYDPGVCEAHPALDRLCFLLEPDGVRVHWLTDGLFDRTEIRPDNLHDEPRNRRGSGVLRLRERDWNRLRLTVHGDTVDLALNGELVYQRELEPTNQRNFGLFHYADRTELRVRNITWGGDWPRAVPRIGDQELAIDETSFLDKRLPELTAVFSHDFATQALPGDRFTVVQGDPATDPATDLANGPDGLHATRRAVSGYRNVTIAANLRVSGDFDITASFDQLVLDPRGSGNSSINLMAIVDNATADECQLVRRWTLAGNGDRHIIQWIHAHQAEESERRHAEEQAMEALAGTLRLARRDDRVYYLFAENDSQQFRMIGEDSFPVDDLQMQGVCLKTQIYGTNGATSVVWKNLTIRAEGLSGPAIDTATVLPDVDQEQ
jgi:Domain of unknown function (DUF1583_N)/Protein of unknown function (DUF1583) C domain/Protein of unknown function (DUF1581)